MEGFFTYFVGVLAYNVTASVVAFAVAFFSCHKRYAVSWLRGGTVLIAGWFLGSVLAILVHLVAALVGIDIENTAGLQMAVALSVLLPVMFLLLGASRPKHLPPSAQ